MYSFSSSVLLVTLKWSSLTSDSKNLGKLKRKAKATTGMMYLARRTLLALESFIVWKGIWHMLTMMVLEVNWRMHMLQKLQGKESEMNWQDRDKRQELNEREREIEREKNIV